LQTEDGNATSIQAFDDERVIVNMSVWESVDDLAEFVYRSDHVAVMRRRREWFERLDLSTALWWIHTGDIPTIQEAQERLAHLGEHGPTPRAFTFRQRFGDPSTGDASVVLDSELGCPA